MVQFFGYLPRYEAPGPLDLAPLSSGIDSLGEGWGRGITYGNNVRLGNALAKGAYGEAMGVAGRMGDPDAVLKVRSYQQAQGDRARAEAERRKKELMEKTGRIASLIYAETDPGKKASMWRSLVGVHPEFGSKLRQYGVDPGDHDAGARFLMTEAGMEIPQSAAPDFMNVPGVGLVKTQGGNASVAIPAQGEQMTPYQREQIAIEREKLGRKPGVDLAPVDKKELYEADDSAAASASAMQALDRALELHTKAYSGLLANERAMIGGVFGDERSLAAQELNNVITGQALESLKAIFGGMPTEGERKILIDIQGSAEQPYAVRERILRAARAAAERRLRQNQLRSEQIRSGEYFQPGRAAVGAPAAAPVRAVNEAGQMIEWNPETGQWMPVQ